MSMKHGVLNPLHHMSVDRGDPWNKNMIYDVSYMEALKRGFKQYATFSGRASRSEFWRFMVSREIIIK